MNAERNEFEAEVRKIKKRKRQTENAKFLSSFDGKLCSKGELFLNGRKRKKKKQKVSGVLADVLRSSMAKLLFGIRFL